MTEYYEEDLERERIDSYSRGLLDGLAVAQLMVGKQKGPGFDIDRLLQDIAYVEASAKAMRIERHLNELLGPHSESSWVQGMRGRARASAPER